MNSPSSSETTFQPMRMWRLSESDLYCVAMKMRRRPELMQLLSGEIDDAIRAAEVDRRLRTLFGQGVETFAGSAGQQDDEDVVQDHRGTPSLRERAPGHPVRVATRRDGDLNMRYWRDFGGRILGFLRCSLV